MARSADADGVAEAELAGAQVEETLADGGHLLDRDVALPRVAEAHRDIRPDVEAVLAGPLHRRLEHRELLVEAAVEVLLGERLGGAAEDRDVPDAELQGPVEATLVGHQHRVAVEPAASRVELVETSYDVLRVGQLGHPLRVHEAGRLDDRQPRGGEPVDELDLGGGRDQALLVLQAVARADLVDRDRLGEVGVRHDHRLPDHACASSTLGSTTLGSTTNRVKPSATWSPVFALTSVTVPANGALSASSIFIASMTPSVSPSATA